jgi:hypothetical protein
MERPQLVTVNLGPKVNLDQTQKIVANVLGKLGCGRCFSGFDIRFAHINELVVNPRTLEVNEIAGH